MAENQDSGNTLAGVDWPLLFPWLLLFRSFRVAIGASVLAVATLGALATPMGWRLLEPIYPSAEASAPEQAELPAVNITQLPPQYLGKLPWQEIGREPQLADPLNPLREAPAQMARMPNRLVRPWAEILLSRLGMRETVYYALGCLWTLLVWGMCGGVISRIAIVQLGRQERVGLVESVRFVCSRPAFFCAPLLPQIAFVVALIFGGGIGLLMRLNIGVFLTALAWPLVLLLGLLCTIIFFGLLFGWPLMWGVISAEKNGDVFEASQRSYSYSFDRPLKYLFYIAIAFVFGCLCWWLVRWFVHGVVYFTDWSLAWGAGWERIHELKNSDKGILSVGGWIISVCNALVLSVAAGFSYSYFWVAFSAIYLLLRRDVDEGVPFEKIYFPEESESYQLPSLQYDGTGVPGVADPPQTTTQEDQPTNGEESGA